MTSNFGFCLIIDTLTDYTKKVMNMCFSNSKEVCMMAALINAICSLYRDGQGRKVAQTLFKKNWFGGSITSTTEYVQQLDTYSELYWYKSTAACFPTLFHYLLMFCFSSPISSACWPYNLCWCKRGAHNLQLRAIPSKYNIKVSLRSCR